MYLFFQCAQAELRLPPHRLITETPTKWGSRQKMIQRVIEQEKAISQVLRAERKTRHLVPSWQEMDVLESVSKTLGPLIEFTDALSGEEYVSVSYLKPVLHLLNNTVLTPAEDDTDLTKDMKKSILKYLNEKYSEAATDDLLDMASLLDPRFGATYIADDRKEYVKNKAAAEITSLLQRQANSTEELCIPATSAPSERAFSTGGNIVTCHRSALEPETVDRLVFLANNL